MSSALFDMFRRMADGTTLARGGRKGWLHGPRYTNDGITPGSPFINLSQYGGKHYAENIHRDLIRQQFADYRARYLPIAQGLLRDVGENFNQNLQNEMGLTARTIANVAGAEEGAAERRMDRYGIKKDYDLGNTTTSSLVGGLNATRIAALDRRDAIQAGGAGLRSAMASGGNG